MKMQELTIEEAIDRIDQLIDAGIGDPSRLDNIRESLRQNKTLFTSDRLYVEKLLDSSITFTHKESSQNPLLSDVQKLIDTGSGDHGRLQSIYAALLQGRSLYQSDYNYVQRKLNEISDNFTNTGITEKTTLKQTDEQNSNSQQTEAKKYVLSNDLNTNESVSNIPKIVKHSDDDTMVDEHTSILSETSELSKIKQTTSEQIKQIQNEKSNLESQIKMERERIASQIKLFEQISAQKAEIEKVRLEGITVLDEIKKERDTLIKESETEKEKLIQIQKEQKEIEEQIQQNQIRLLDMRESYKSNSDEQVKLIKQLRDEETQLNNTKIQLDEIRDQIEQEKQSLANESAQQKDNLAKLKSEKESLEKTKADYDSILADIEQEKQSLANESAQQKDNLAKLKSEKESLEKTKADYDSILAD
ncbi:MAG: hypothetical protein OEX98_08355, partial [Nitrosopumilus sp.]|nr:hypothetical protein [Nitrosopumilus sp.]